MSDLNNHISIPNEVTQQDASNFNFLKQKGIEYIEQLGREFYTNYNDSDTGTVIRDALIYGITDLELRIQQPIQDILTQSNDTSSSHKSQFHTAKEILTTGPINENDYRRSIIDINGVKNAWLTKYELPVYMKCINDYSDFDFDGDFVLSFEPIQSSDYKTSSFNVKGLYSILIDFDDYWLDQKGNLVPTNKMEVMDRVYDLYHANRNLCEDLAEIRQVQEIPIQVCAKLQLEDEANEEWVDAKIRVLIEEYLSPTIRSYSLKELLSKGYPTDEIFDGPVLENGFLLSSDVEKAQLRKEVRQSDIIRIIMGIPGVRYIEDIKIQTSPLDEIEKECCTSSHDEFSDDWIICIPTNHKPVLSANTTLQYFKKFIKLTINSNAQEIYLKQLRSEYYNTTMHKYEDIKIPTGKHLNLKEYYSIQNNMPEMYGIGENNLGQEETDHRRIQAKQLKAYLCTMEQTLAIYFGQVEYISKLLSYDKSVDSNYYPNTIEGIRDRDEILQDRASYHSNLVNSIKKLENFPTKRFEFLNQLLARFAEKFSNYYLILNRADHEDYLRRAIDVKCDFLADYDEISYHRANAFNYTKRPLWDSLNQHGIQRRMAYYIGLLDKTRRDLYNSGTGENVNGLYGIESIALLPTKPKRLTKLFTDVQILESTNKYYWEAKIAGCKLRGFHQQISQLSAMEDFENTVAQICKNIHNNSGFSTEVRGSELGLIIKNGNKILAKSVHTYNNPIDKIISPIKEVKNDDAFEMCCFRYQFIDIKDSHLKFKSCALPCVDDDCFSCSPIDFYSYRITFAFTGWTERFSNMSFRKTVEQEFYQNLAAHIQPRFCWVGYERGNEIEGVPNDILLLQEAWKKYLDWKSDSDHDMASYMDLVQDLQCKINHLNNIYKHGKLINCEEEEDPANKIIILNQTSLGSLKNE